MDELSGLIGQLQREVGALDRALRLREAEEGEKLRVNEQRLALALARVERAKQALQSDGAALAKMEENQKHLLARIKGWRGVLWRIGHESVVVVMATALVTSFPVLMSWLHGEVGKVFGAQLAVFLALYFLIPKKK